MNEPIKHHYIPQFILRNFSFDDKRHIYCYNKISKESTIQETRDIFMARHLYRDEINSPEYPTKLEHDFSVFEREISVIIKSKFLREYKITLSMEEDAKLRLFLAIMGFRAERNKDFFHKGLSEFSKKFYEIYQPDRDFVDLLKRNLGYIVNCRSIQDVIEHSEIDEAIKLFFRRDTFGLLGMYFVVVERHECEDFVIGDSYPVVVTGTIPNGVELHLYSIFPISPNRIILMVSNGAEDAPREAVGFRPCVLALPKMNSDGTYEIRVKKVYNEEVKPINEMIIKEARYSVAFKDEKQPLKITHKN